MDFKEKAFEFVFEAMRSAGGDGDAILCCDKWKEAADDFEKWLAKNHPNFLKRNDEAERVTFWDGQEGVTIAHFDYDTSPKAWTEAYVRTLLF